MSEKHRNEKDEKDEKGRGESWDEKWRRDPVEAFVWALILIWAGLVWLADNLGWWDQILGEKVEPWAIGFLGAGVIVLLGVLIRVLVPAYRRPVIGSIIFGIILLGIGLGQMTDWIAMGAIILIGIGIAILLTGFFRRKE
jgi:hypothetical protein